jgi:polar amino acid transport system substrate-binding protein
MKNFLLIAFLLFPCLSKGSEVELKIVTEEWPPFIINSAEVSGIITKNIREILAYTDIDYSITIYPWARSLHIVSTRPNTLIYSITRTSERENKFNWICSVFNYTPIYVYKLKSNIINAHSLEALKSGVVGIMRNDHSYEYFLNEGFKVGVNIDLSANEEINLKKLIKGRVDVVIQSKESIEYRLKILGEDNIDIVSGLSLGKNEDTQHCMALSLGTNLEIIHKLRKAFKQWQEDQQ